MYEEYLSYLRDFKKRSSGTLRQYGSVLKEFSKYPLDAEGLGMYLREIASNSPKTQQLKISVVKNYLEWLYENGKVERRFWKNLEPPKAKTLPHYLTREELEKFLAAVDDPYYMAVFRFLVNTGLRISELLNLRKEDVSISGDTARIRVRGKGAKERMIVVSSRVVRELEKAGFFRKKVSARSIQRRMRYYVERAGIKKRVTPHSLRHTFAILLMEKGIPLNRVQSILGHESIATTSVYLKLVGEERIPEIV